MKKFLYFIAVCFFFSACVETNEDKIISAFKNYVQNNFDDPNELVEILSVEARDTVSKKQLKDIVMGYEGIYYELDSMNRTLSNSFTNLTNSSSAKTRARLASNSNFMNSLHIFKDCAEETLLTIEGFNRDFYMDKLKNEKDTTILRFVIKCRTRKNGNLKLDSFYVQTDSLFSDIKFKGEDFTPEEMNFGEIFDTSTKLLQFYEKLIEIEKLENKHLKNLLRFFNQ